MDGSIAYAKKYLEDVLSFFGINTDVEAKSQDGEVIELNIPSTQFNGFLIGQRGETVRALQFMVSSALNSQNHDITRVNVDVADYKKQRAERLAETAKEWVAQVKTSGEAYDVRPMNAADRRVVHKVAAEAGVSSESVGEDRSRHIVLKPTPEPIV